MVVASIQADVTRGVKYTVQLRFATDSERMSRASQLPGGRLQVPLQKEFSRVWKSKSNKSKGNMGRVFQLGKDAKRIGKVFSIAMFIELKNLLEMEGPNRDFVPPLLVPRDFVRSHVGLERQGDQDGPILLLVVFHQRQPAAPHGEARAI